MSFISSIPRLIALFLCVRVLLCFSQSCVRREIPCRHLCCRRCTACVVRRVNSKVVALFCVMKMFVLPQFVIPRVFPPPVCTMISLCRHPGVVLFVFFSFFSAFFLFLFHFVFVCSSAQRTEGLCRLASVIAMKKKEKSSKFSFTQVSI